MSSQTKVPGFAATVAGALIGAGAVGLGLATLPIAIPAGLVVGGVVDLLRRKHSVSVTVIPPPSAPSVSVMRILNRASPNTPAATMAASAAQAVASPPPEATMLHAYLRANPYANMAKLGMLPLMQAVAQRAQLVRAFQQAFNLHELAARAFTKTLAVNGTFDMPTSAALAFFTHDIIPADPKAAAPASGGDAGTSADATASASLDISL